MAADGEGLVQRARGYCGPDREVEMQHPIMRRLEGGATAAVETWEARAEADIAVFIMRYLAENPCPGPSPVRSDLARWSRALEADGQARLQELGAGRLRMA